MKGEVRASSRHQKRLAACPLLRYAGEPPRGRRWQGVDQIIGVEASQPVGRLWSMQELSKWVLQAAKLPLLSRYLIAILVVLAALAMRRALGDLLQGYPFILFYPAIMLCGMLLGRGSGFLATVLSAVLAALFMIPPMHPDNFGDAIGLAIFSASGLLIAVLTEGLHAAYADLGLRHGEMSSAAREKEFLLRELSHRTRNDFATMVSLLELQAQALEEPAREALQLAAERVRMLARVHHRLSLTGERVVVDSRAFLGELCDEMRGSRIGLRPLEMECRFEAYQIGQEKAVALGLIMNELVTNALKHAFPDGRKGHVQVSFERHGQTYRLTIADDGVGLPASVGKSGMGHALARALTSQFGGQFETKRGSPGTTVVVSVPVVQSGPASSPDQPEAARRRTEPGARGLTIIAYECP